MYDYEDTEGDEGGGAGAGAGGDGKAGAGDGAGKGGADNGAVKTVPYERFQSTVAAKNAALERVTALEAEVQHLSERAATVDTLGQQVTEWKSKHAEAVAKFTTHRDIAAGLGTTVPDVIEAAEWQYGKLPAEGRPKIGDWITGLKAKPDEAPVVLRPFLAAAEKEVVKPQPRAVGGGKQPNADAKYSAEELRAARAKAMATGDFTELRAMRKSWRPEAADKT